MKLSFALLLILLSFILLIFGFSLLFIAEYSRRSAFFSLALSKSTLFFLVGFCLVLSHFAYYCPVVYVKYSTITFVFCVPLLIILTVLLCSFLVYCIYFCEVNFKFEELILFVFFLFISFYAISARDLISVLVCLEGTNICLFIFLMSSNTNNSIMAIESTLKYIFVSMISSLFLILGTNFIYLNWGVFNYYDLTLLLKYSLFCPALESIIGYCGIMFVCFAFLIKLGVFPFYFWMVNVYNGMSSLGLIFTTVLTKTVMLVMFTTFIYYVKVCPGLSALLIVLAIGSLIISTAFLFYTDNIREFVAFISLASSGFLLLILANLTEVSYFLCIFYIIVQAFNLLFTFGVLSFFKTKTLFPKMFWQVRNYVEINLSFFAMFCFVIFSLIGIPPFAGFFPKMVMLYYLYSIKAYGTLLLFGVFTLASSLYFVRILQFFSVKNKSQGVLFLTRKFRKMYGLILAFIFFTLIILLVIVSCFSSLPISFLLGMFKLFFTVITVISGIIFVVLFLIFFIKLFMLFLKFFILCKQKMMLLWQNFRSKPNFPFWMYCALLVFYNAVYLNYAGPFHYIYIILSDLFLIFAAALQVKRQLNPFILFALILSVIVYYAPSFLLFFDISFNIETNSPSDFTWEVYFYSWSVIMTLLQFLFLDLTNNKNFNQKGIYFLNFLLILFAIFFASTSLLNVAVWYICTLLLNIFLLSYVNKNVMLEEKFTLQSKTTLLVLLTIVLYLKIFSFHFTFNYETHIHWTLYMIILLSLFFLWRKRHFVAVREAVLIFISIFCLRLLSIIAINTFLYFHGFTQFYGDFLFLIFAFPFVLVFLTENTTFLLQLLKTYYTALNNITIERFIIILICIFLVDVTFFDILLSILPSSVIFTLFEIEMEPKRCMGNKMFCQKNMYHSPFLLERQSRRYIFIATDPLKRELLGLESKRTAASHIWWQPGDVLTWNKGFLGMTHGKVVDGKETAYIADFDLKDSKKGDTLMPQRASEVIIITEQQAKEIGAHQITDKTQYPNMDRMEKEGTKERANLEQAYNDPTRFNKDKTILTPEENKKPILAPEEDKKKNSKIPEKNLKNE